MAELQSPPAIEPNTRFKYSNHGFGLLGLVIEAITKEPYRVWIEREIVDAAGLRETKPDMPIAKGIPVRARPYASASRGPAPRHSRRQPGQRNHAGRGLRQHGGGRGPLLRATGAECEAQRAFRRQPPRDDPETLAQSACEPGRVLRPRNHERHDGRLGLVRPYRRIPGLYLADLRHPRLRSDHHHPDQLHRWLGRILA